MNLAEENSNLIKIDDYLNKRQIEDSFNDLLTKFLNKSGIFYRLWVRVKSTPSINKKLAIKTKSNADYKLQDLFGIRIACYFQEDLPLCEHILSKHFNEIFDSASIDDPDPVTFKPTRRNHVYTLPEDILNLIANDLWNLNFDKTFEVQIRTIFSEGWHEVEHDLRYKNHNIWETIPDLSRKLNGILATLETSEWALNKVFDDLAYKCYKSKDWENMLINKVRLRLTQNNISDNIINIFNQEQDIAKKFLNFDREKLVSTLTESSIPIPLKIDNIIFLINEIEIKNENISNIMPEFIKTIL